MTKPIRKHAGPTAERYAQSGTEDAHSIALMMWAQESRELYPELKWLFHIPNGGYRTKAGAGKLKAMGVKIGAPDYCLMVRRGAFASLWIELKRPKTAKKAAGRASDEQGIWIERIRSQGHGAMVCVGWEAAKDAIIQYLEFKG